MSCLENLERSGFGFTPTSQGLDLATQIFLNESSPFVSRISVLLTDGNPTRIGVNERSSLSLSSFAVLFSIKDH